MTDEPQYPCPSVMAKLRPLTLVKQSHPALSAAWPYLSAEEGTR